MKSSVRILAIALALAFLLLARTAFQADTEASAAEIDLSDGEASFADPIDGSMEAKYLGFGDMATQTVYFYIDSDDLGTQITARTMHTGDISGTETGDGTLQGASQVYTLIGGNTPPSMVNGVRQTTEVDPEGADPTATADTALADSTTLVTAFDAAYCADRDMITASYTDDGNLMPGATTTIAVPTAWGLLSTTSAATAGQCPTPGDDDRPVGERMLVATTTADTRDQQDPPQAITGANDQRTAARVRLADKALADANKDQVDPAIENNALQYMYKSGNKYVAATSTNPARRYTNGVGVTTDTPRDTVGGPTKPLSSVVFKIVDKDTDDPKVLDDRSTTIPTFESNNAGGDFRLAYTVASVGLDPAGDGDYEAAAREFTVDATFNIVDVYQAKDTTAAGADHPAYTSGYGRAYVSSGSDSGTWVTISEVAAVNDDHDASGSPTSNLFRGMVVITNDTDYNDDDTIYAQDGETLTLQVFDENGNRSSDVLATATALIDDSPPTISNLSPASGSEISDDTLRISFDVNDDGAGSDFRNIEKVVTMVQVEKRADSGDKPRSTGIVCPLASGEDDIDNAGGNAGSVGVLIAPANAKFSSRCGDIVKTGDGGKFNLIITAQDLAGNVTKQTTQLTIDTSKPTVVGPPQVGQGWNEDGNKASDSANSILVGFNESLDVDTVSAADFTVSGYTVESVQVVGTDDKKNMYVVITLTEDLANNARPSVTVSGVSDVAGNAIDSATRTSDNYIKSVLTVVPFSALIAEDGQQAVSFTSDEALRSSGKDIRTGANAKTGTSVNGNTSGLSIKVADDTMGGSGTFKQSTNAFSESGAYGVMIQALDQNGNVTRAGAVSVDNDDVELAKSLSADPSVKLANWPPADANLDGSFAGEVKAYNGKVMVASSTDSNTSPDWSAGTVDLAINAGVDSDLIAAGQTITLKYSYVTADQVIQVDVTPPTMSSKPKNNDETDYASGAIRFIWSDDDNYAGDSYKTVTLNEASHEGPDGESVDILDKLTSNDNKTWVLRPAEDLALGDHEFTLKATDAAGNSNEVSVTITVIERKATKVTVSPGWNLISFRGAPASLDVNDIFTDDTVSVVSQYDGRRVSPWTVWTRGSDGTMSSSPAGRTNIDPSLGLYVLSTDGTALQVDIPGTSRDNPTVLPPSINLIPGWNLIAVIILDRDTTKVSVDDYLPAGVWSRAFKLDNDNGVLVSISPKGDDDDGAMVDAGQALWVYADKAGVVTPNK